MHSVESVYNNIERWWFFKGLFNLIYNKKNNIKYRGRVINIKNISAMEKAGCMVCSPPYYSYFSNGITIFYKNGGSIEIPFRTYFYTINSSEERRRKDAERIAQYHEAERLLEEIESKIKKLNN